jgi:hypothetical protein
LGTAAGTLDDVLLVRWVLPAGGVSFLVESDTDNGESAVIGLDFEEFGVERAGEETALADFLELSGVDRLGALIRLLAPLITGALTYSRIVARKATWMYFMRAHLWQTLGLPLQIWLVISSHIALSASSNSNPRLSTASMKELSFDRILSSSMSGTLYPAAASGEQSMKTLMSKTATKINKEQTKMATKTMTVLWLTASKIFLENT